VNARPRSGPVNQKRRTRAAIIAACQELITSGAEITAGRRSRGARLRTDRLPLLPGSRLTARGGAAGIGADRRRIGGRGRSWRSGRAGRLRRRAAGEARHRASGRDPRAHIGLDRAKHRSTGAAGLPLRSDRSVAGSAFRPNGIDAATLEQLRRDLAVSSAPSRPHPHDLYASTPERGASIVHTLGSSRSALSGPVRARWLRGRTVANSCVL